MQSKPPSDQPRRKIGIIAGSGPEAGVDLWQKILEVNKRILGREYRGDLDAPHVTIISEPALGLSMELAENDAAVWASLEQAVRLLAAQVDLFAIACNTLNHYQVRIRELGLPAELVSVSEVVADHAAAHNLSRVALLAAKPVTDLGPWSPFRALTTWVDIELPRDPEALHRLIYDVKALGAGQPGLAERFAAVLDELSSEVVLLACTELPLIMPRTSRKRLVDVTELLAEALVRRALD